MRYARLLVALSSAGLSTAATVCNGYPELCSKLYPDVSVVGAHNSYTASNTNLAANQDYGVTQQLTDGVRLLQNQVHLQNGQLRLCHTSCLLYDGGLLSDYLTKVQTWMNSNPTEIVTLLLVNIDNQPVTAFSSVYSSLGLDKVSFVPQSAVTARSAWPTYGALIDAGTRLVTLMDNGASFSTVPYIIDEFSNMWEDYYDVESPSGFNCTIQRATGNYNDGRMYLINHYLYQESELFGGSTPVPDKAALPVTNAASGAGSLGEEAEVTCVQYHNVPPTFLLVDFYDWGGGSVFQVAATLNNVTYVAKSIAPQNGTDGTSSGTQPTSTVSAARASGVAITALGVVVGTVLGSLLMV